VIFEGIEQRSVNCVAALSNRVAANDVAANVVGANDVASATGARRQVAQHLVGDVSERGPVPSDGCPSHTGAEAHRIVRIAAPVSPRPAGGLAQAP
jgi:hypothetical protein